jgi:hypothetical protein
VTDSNTSDFTVDDAQALHDQLRAENPDDHDQVSCWCCCLDCDFDFNTILKNTAKQRFKENDGH